MKHDYSRNIRNAGAQEVFALKRAGRAVKKGTAHRGKDLRVGK